LIWIVDAPAPAKRGKTKAAGILVEMISWMVPSSSVRSHIPDYIQVPPRNARLTALMLMMVSDDVQCIPFNALFS